MPKFFVEDHQILNEKNLEIQGEDVRHIRDVLRLKKEDEIQVCNLEKGENYLCKILEFREKTVLCEMIQKVESEAEPKNQIVVYQALPKQEKMEWILQKATELGMEALVPVVMSRCIVKLDEKSTHKKVERWQKIVESAAKQSGRDRISNVDMPCAIKELTEKISEFDLFLVAYEKEESHTLKEELKQLKKKQKRIAILIGPEGGITTEEVLMLQENGAKVVTLGKRILRTETVALNMISNILYELEE